MEQPKIAIIIGTRPEAIKMAPVFLESLKTNENTYLYVSGQHTDMVDDVLRFFGISKNVFRDKIERNTNSINEIFAQVLLNVERFILKYDISQVLVHGDTTTAAAAAVSAYNLKRSVAHVEAGLRSGDFIFPFPEEMNRKLISQTAKLNFAPTEQAKKNLLNSGCDNRNIYVVGNTIVDALNYAKKKISNLDLKIDKVLVTIHRRENLSNLDIISEGINELSLKYPDIQFVWPLHPNPKIRLKVEQRLGCNSNVTLMNHLGYGEFITAMLTSLVVITDSGGIQEECATLGIPTLIVREQTERPEVLDHGIADLVGVNIAKLASSFATFIKLERRPSNVFGDGKTSSKIISML